MIFSEKFKICREIGPNFEPNNILSFNIESSEK